MKTYRSIRLNFRLGLKIPTRIAYHATRSEMSMGTRMPRTVRNYLQFSRLGSNAKPIRRTPQGIEAAGKQRSMSSNCVLSPLTTFIRKVNTKAAVAHNTEGVAISFAIQFTQNQKRSIGLIKPIFLLLRLLMLLLYQKFLPMQQQANLHYLILCRIQR